MNANGHWIKKEQEADNLRDLLTQKQLGQNKIPYNFTRYFQGTVGENRLLKKSWERAEAIKTTMQLLVLWNGKKLIMVHQEDISA